MAVYNPYDIAAAMFDETARLFEEDADRTEIPVIRTNLGQITEMLRALDLEGMAEGTESLPASDEIQCFDYLGLGRLINDLRQRYFPTEEVFEAA